MCEKKYEKITFLFSYKNILYYESYIIIIRSKLAAQQGQWHNTQANYGKTRVAGWAETNQNWPVNRKHAGYKAKTHTV